MTNDKFWHVFHARHTMHALLHWYMIMTVGQYSFNCNYQRSMVSNMQSTKLQGEEHNT